MQLNLVEAHCLMTQSPSDESGDHITITTLRDEIHQIKDSGIFHQTPRDYHPVFSRRSKQWSCQNPHGKMQLSPREMWVEPEKLLEFRLKPWNM